MHWHAMKRVAAGDSKNRGEQEKKTTHGFMLFYSSLFLISAFLFSKLCYIHMFKCWAVQRPFEEQVLKIKKDHRSKIL